MRLLVLLIVLVATPAWAQSVVSVTLINADTDQPVSGFDPIPASATLDLSTLPTTNLNIRVNTSPTTVGSVVCTYDGTVIQTENTAPYACWGDSSGNYNVWTPTVGVHTLTVTPYPSASGGGTAGAALTRMFTVTAGGTTPPPPTEETVPANTPFATAADHGGINTTEYRCYLDNSVKVTLPLSALTNGQVVCNFSGAPVGPHEVLTSAVGSGGEAKSNPLHITAVATPQAPQAPGRPVLRHP